MKIAFVHQNFPGQFGHVASALADDSANTVVAIGEKGHLGRLRHPRITEVTYDKPQGANRTTHHYLRDLEAATRRGQAVVRLVTELAKQGFRPDVVYCHPGWGEGLFLREAWPDARLLYFFEFYYHARGYDTGFDPEFPLSFDAMFRTRIKKAHLLLSMAVADWGITPTRWQFSSLPAEYQARTSIIFDGIDTGRVRPDAGAKLELPSGTTLTPTDEVVTFVSRNLEPYRGYHIFMRALPEILLRRPSAHAVIVGADGVSYGRSPPEGKTWKQIYRDEVAARLDMTRVHFVGRVPYEMFLQALQVSSAHVYLTYPFVLSWSMLEAMSAGCLVVGSRTAPVEEMIVDGENGLLVDFFDVAGFADAVCQVLAHADRMQALRDAARRTVVKHYDLKSRCLPQILQTIHALADGRLSASAPAGAGLIKAHDQSKIIEELARCRLWIESALAYSGTHDYEDIVDGVLSGKMQLWAGDAACGVSQIAVHPKRKILHVFVAAGDMEQLLDFEESAIQFAKMNGCDAMTLSGRSGWKRALKDKGWKEQSVNLRKEF